MSTAPDLVEADASSFEREALERSHEVPVLVDFWAAWCGPCQALAPVLESLAGAYGGRLRIVKVDTDSNPELAGRFGVRSLPTMKLLSGGTEVGELVGLQPESAIRALVDAHVRRPSDEVLDAARALGDAARPAEARTLLEQALIDDPENPRLAPALAETLLALGDIERLDALLASLPAATRLDEGWRAISARAAFTREESAAPDEATLTQQIAADPADCTARLALGSALAARGRYDEAVEQLLEVLRRERGNGDARDALIGIFTILGDDDRVAGYRSRMASALY